MSFSVDSRRESTGLERRKLMEASEPMNLNVHWWTELGIGAKYVKSYGTGYTSGGIRDVIWAKSAGRCGKGRVSTMNATLVGSYGEGGGGGGGHSGGGGKDGQEGAAAGTGIELCEWDSMVE